MPAPSSPWRLRLVVARHGNTFEAGQTPTRVGARTDLPLTAAGLEQGRRLGEHWAREGLAPAALWCAPLLRTRQTAEAALAALGLDMTPRLDERFREIDYGPDENRPETVVRRRLGRLRLGEGAADNDAEAAGRQVIEDWDGRAIVPDGWLVDPAALADLWRGFAEECRRQGEDGRAGRTMAVVTSNGIARFAALLLPGGFDGFNALHPAGPKLATGAYAVFALDADGAWHCPAWNVRP